MTDIQITKARLAAIREAAGICLERMPTRVQKPAGSYESDYRYSKFSRHHKLRA
jgi:hypothetical protein